MKEKIKKYWWVIIIILVITTILAIGSFYLGMANGDPNKTFIYGATGLPRNCRAIIAENIQGWKDGVYTAEGALSSIERNCGAEGISW